MLPDMKATTETVIALIGAARLASAVGVTPPAVSLAKTTGIFPARWAVQVRRLLAEDGRDPEHEAPDRLFNFK